jgi:membrane-associated protein
MNFIDLGTLLAKYGVTAVYVILFAIIFAESGLFFGFFLPGDSLLLTAGLFAYKNAINGGGPNDGLTLWVLLPLLFVAAVLGDNVGYWFGKKTAPRLFTRPRSLVFRPRNLLAAKAFYDKHGGKTITLARFMPFIRTFVPIVAGAVQMNYRKFMLYNFVGGFVWAVGLTYIGYSLGRVFPPEVLDKYFLIIIIVVIIVSAMPAMLHVWKEHRHR